MIGAERTDFVGVPVTDRDRAPSSSTARRSARSANPLAHEEWPEFETGNVTILLNTPEQTGVPFSPSNTARSRCACRTSAEAMKQARGGRGRVRLRDAYDSGVCHMAFFKDPDGNSLILHHRHAPYADGTTP